MKGQSRKASFAESLLNVAIGYGIAVTAQIVVFPWFGIHIPLEDNLTIGLIFTVVSICRSYVLRRAFNWWHVKTAPEPKYPWYCDHGRVWDDCPDCRH